ncbi:hypothetical protein AB0O14_19165, partial [Microbacterium foliorum]
CGECVGELLGVWCLPWHSLDFFGFAEAGDCGAGEAELFGDVDPALGFEEFVDCSGSDGCDGLGLLVELFLELCGFACDF